MNQTAILGIALIVAAAIAMFLLMRKGGDAPAAAPAGRVDSPPPTPAKAPAPPATATPVPVPSMPPPPAAPRELAAPVVRHEYLDEGDPVEDTAPNPLILVTAVGRTDPGMKRKHNEDAYLVMDDHHLFVVADGMGRHKAGEVASKLAVGTVERAFATGDFGPSQFQADKAKEENRLRAVFDLANREVFEQSLAVEDYQGMGTTMVSVHFSRDKERAAIAHAGDSRCYRLRGGELVQLTTDHTLGAAGIVGPSANVLSRAVGIEENLEPDVMLDRPQPGDTYLICSDGLSRMVSHEKIAESLGKESDLDVAANELIDMANKAGGRDNVTVILVRVDRAKLDF
jgi:protein phosphatase